MKTRNSYGIILVHTKKREVLLVQRRVTYAYSDFVFGHYSIANLRANNRNLIKLFSGMTINEKLDILSGSFQQIWYRIWLNHVPTYLDFQTLRARYEQFFQDKERLAYLLNCAHNSECMWEAPKGGRSGIEIPINTAIREFIEETHIPRSEFRITNNIFTCEYIDNEVRYVIHYYLALSTINTLPEINIFNEKQVNELSQVKWFNSADIGRAHIHENMKRTIKCAINYVKKYY